MSHIISRLNLHSFSFFVLLTFCLGLFGLLFLYPLTLALPSLKLHDITTVFLSVIIEASPFLLLGSLVSVFIQRTDLTRYIHRIPKNPLIGLPLSALIGVFLPICECGNMPIARSLVSKGLSSSYATTFLFSAPILNPAVFFSTWVAFQGQPLFIALRFVLGFIVAVASGAYVAWQEKRGVPIWKSDCTLTEKTSPQNHEHSHDRPFSLQVFQEFFAIFPYLFTGALFTAIFQAYVPRESFFNSHLGIAFAILIMMLFAFIISVCSNTDAFLAIGFSGIVPPAAILSFLVFGAMIDSKNVLIYSRIFTLRGLILISFFIAELVFLLTLLIHKVNIL